MTIRSFLTCLTMAMAAVAAPAEPAQEEAKKVLDLMYKVRAYQQKHPWRAVDRNWIRATYTTGLMGMYRTTKDPDILKQATQWAEKHQWREGNERPPANRKTCGQTYLELYFLDPKPERIAAIRAYVDSRMQRIAQGESPLKGWYYVDTLYVGPPTLAMLGKATGEKKYYDYLHRVYWTVADHLLDKDDGLFYRDARYFKARTGNGRKVLWSRGNGWAFGGIPRVLEHLPKDDPQRERYVKLLRAMAEALVARQPADGLWRSNLDDAEQHPNPETSGTAFFCYGLAWGVNEGLLAKPKYLPAALKAWAGLVRHVNDEGRLGYVQPVGGDPRAASADQTHEYAAGLFLLAGCEIHRMLISGTCMSPAELIRHYAEPPKAPRPASAGTGNVTVFARNGGWCWFQDPRAIIHDGKLIVGSVSGAGKGRGDVRASVYDLKVGRDLGTAVLHAKLQSDDHDTPAFYARPDRRVLAVYARHSSAAHYFRISEPGDPTRWGPEQAHKHARPISYMNLYDHPADKKLYNFYRDSSRATFCPFYMTSTDHGSSWQAGGQLIAHSLSGRHRPYPRYWSDGEYIHVSFTESHPQEFRGAGCGIYYAKFKAGTFYRADGTRIKDIGKDGPLLPREAETVFAGTPDRSAWTSSIRADAKGRIHIAYSVRRSRSDHRFRYAAWDGKAWSDQEVAYAGVGLYPRAFDYTGLITIDPTNPSRLYFSTNVDPAQGTCLPSGKHEIYQAVRDKTGASWRFMPLTRNSPSANLRPICLAGEGWRVLLWLRGRYTTFTDFDQDVVGIIEKVE
ncbi:glycoside hydrolase family 88 protein [bacterium]|nr:glycoside hydrolase family 88 protein [bacterium]